MFGGFPSLQLSGQFVQLQMAPASLYFHITSGFIWVSRTILFYSPGLEIHQCKSFLGFLALFHILLVNVCQVFFPSPLPLWVLCSASDC